MKILKYIFLSSIAAFTLNSCNTLDIKNTTSYDADQVWQDKSLSTAFVTNLYMQVFPNWSSSIDNNSEQMSGMPFYEGTITLTSSSYKKWDYTNIRLINEAIQELENGTLDATTKNSLLGQVYFLRAYVYTWMVIYHGGVPYITKPQDKDVDDLMVKRNSTAECFQYIVADIDKAISLLPAKIKSSSSDYGRIDQCFAKSFKAKVLLYKASPQFNPSNQYGNAYWNEAYTAAKEAYDFCLSQGAALTTNYADTWLIEGGNEVIFAVINSNPNRVVTNWENGIRPMSLSRGSTSNPPTWNLVKSFPMLDGKAYNDPTGKYYQKDENALLQSFWKNRDPRFSSSILCNGELYNVAGTKEGYRQYTAVGVADDDDCYGTNPAAGKNPTNNDYYTGFFVRKASDVSLTQDKVRTYDKDFVVMRFAEVMMIYAEAANETGHSDAAVSILKQIRQRAGIEAGSDGMYGLKVSSREEIRQAILDENNIEFCFEGHRFWDMRRTRNLMQLNGLEKFGVEAIAINADGTDMDMETARTKAAAFELKPENFRYVIHQVPLTPNAEKQFVIKESFYFFPIQEVKILENSNLEQNKDWGGTFNPTME